MWYLHTTRAALSATTSLQRLRVHALFKDQKKGRSSLWAASDYQQLLCNAYTRAIRTADRDSNLGRWAALLEFCITHLPYQKNPLLLMIRACSHIHQWSVATPVSGHMIYIVFHVHLFCLYIGRTEGALIARLRKHWTTARSGSEDSPFIACCVAQEYKIGLLPHCNGQIVKRLHVFWKELGGLSGRDGP